LSIGLARILLQTAFFRPRFFPRDDLALCVYWNPYLHSGSGIEGSCTSKSGETFALHNYLKPLAVTVSQQKTKPSGTVLPRPNPCSQASKAWIGGVSPTSAGSTTSTCRRVRKGTATNPTQKTRNGSSFSTVGLPHGFPKTTPTAPVSKLTSASPVCLNVNQTTQKNQMEKALRAPRFQ